MTPARPILRYHGGKWVLAKWIIRHFPPHRVYVEPFGGAASVLLQKPRSYSEVYGELDGEITNVFRVVRDHPARLTRALLWTPFSRQEYELSFVPAECPVEAARRTLIRAFMGFGSNSINRRIRSGFRANSNRSGTTPAHDWANFPLNVRALAGRLRGVVIENKAALELIDRHDGPETLHYLDPPYVGSTRAGNGDDGYLHEMTDEQHEGLAAAARAARGMVVISGYASDLYERLYAGWDRRERKALADGARPRKEMLWINQRASARLAADQTLFGS